MVIPKRINLLYIEDDEQSVDILLKYLKKVKYIKFNIIHKCTLKEGIKYLKDKCEVDVILLDLILPNSKGVASYKKLIKVCSFIPIVIISEHEEIACECVKLGAQDYLIKSDLNNGIVLRSLKYSIERHKLEKSKLEAERKFREVINLTPIGFHNYELIDDELIFTSYNPASDNILEVNNKLSIGKKLKDAFPNLFNTELPTRYMEVLNTGKSWKSNIVDYEISDIKKKYFRVHVFKTSSTSITVSFEDVTNQILIEKKYKNLVEYTRAGIYEIDFINNKFVYVNDVLCELLGYTRKEIMKLTPYDILTTNSIIKWNQRRESLKRGEYIDNSIEYETKRKDGSTGWGLITAEYIEDSKKNIIGANVVVIDISDKKLAEKNSKQKEELVFNELENRLHLWRKEINIRSNRKAERLEVIDVKLSNINLNSEVV